MLADRTLHLYQTSIGKKFVMALSGMLMVGFVGGHMLGNLQIFIGPEALDAYAQALHRVPALLWAVRVVLLFTVFLHIVTAIQLWLHSRRARPVRYHNQRYLAATYASRTMYFTGPAALAFIVYHLLHLTWGTAHPDFEPMSVYRNVVIGFSSWGASSVYILAQIALAFHLAHGFWSMFQTLGLNNERWDGRLRVASVGVAVILAAGNISVPVAVLAGWLTL